MRALALVLAAMAGLGCRDLPPNVEAGPDAAIGPRVRIATFNVRRFFDTVCDSATCGNGAYEELPSQAAFESRADQLAEAIQRLDADVISLQEVETQSCVDALVARLGATLRFGVLGEIDDPGSVDVAILARTPLELTVRHRADEPLTRPDGTTTTFTRELLEVHTVHDTGLEIVVFAAHFKSKSDDDPGRRLAEAQVSRRVVTAAAAAAPAALMVLGGDLNDTPGSPPLNALTLVSAGDAGLIRVADDLPLADQATYRFNGRGQAIDHLLLAPTAAARRIPYGSRVWRDDRGYGGSDHFALTSDFNARSPAFE